jgi:hypothetical protein
MALAGVLLEVHMTQILLHKNNWTDRVGQEKRLVNNDKAVHVNTNCNLKFDRELRFDRIFLKNLQEMVWWLMQTEMFLSCLLGCLINDILDNEHSEFPC